MAVRRLRVFTVIIQCTHRIPRLIESSKFVATAVFLARLACIEMVKQSLEEDEHTAGDAARHPTKAIQMIDAWAATLLVAQATALRSVSSSAAAAVEEALAQSSMRKLLAMLFGITQTLGLHALLNTSSAVETGQLPSLLTAMPRQPGPGSKPIATLSVADSDTLVAQQSIVQTVDAYECHKIFYPSCHAITAEDFVVCDPISLSREAMVINAASSFLLDSAQEIVLFRESQPATAGARERQTTAETGEDAPTVESGDEDDYREVTLDPRDAQHSSTSSIALLAGKPPLALETFVGIRALNVLSRGQGQSGSIGGSEQAKDESTAGLAGAGGTLTTAAPAAPSTTSFRQQQLCSDPDWLPSVLKRRLQVASVVPTVLLASAGKSSACHMTSKLVEDANGGDCLPEFVGRARARALECLK